MESQSLGPHDSDGDSSSHGSYDSDNSGFDGRLAHMHASRQCHPLFEHRSRRGQHCHSAPLYAPSHLHHSGPPNHGGTRFPSPSTVHDSPGRHFGIRNDDNLYVGSNHGHPLVSFQQPMMSPTVHVSDLPSSTVRKGLRRFFDLSSWAQRSFMSAFRSTSGQAQPLPFNEGQPIHNANLDPRMRHTSMGLIFFQI